MTKSQFSCVGVVGAGQMGSGIAQVIAAKGVNVVLMDLSHKKVLEVKARLEKISHKLYEKKHYSEQEKINVKEKICYATDLDSLAACDLVIEAICENESLKKEVFVSLDKIVNKEAIFASNTSSISIARLASVTKRTAAFIGMHFMNPVPKMDLVELISTIATKQEVTTRCTQFIHFIGKKETASQDFPGFVVNRLLMPMINEAFNLLMERVATAKDIDTAMQLGTNHPMGPLTLADFIGLDTCLSIMNVLYDGFKDSKYKPSPLLQQYVDLGWFGRKTSKGVFDYN